MVEETHKCETKGKMYSGLHKNREFKGTYLIRMLCGMIEKNLGLNHTTLLLNRELKKDGKEEVGVSCVCDTYACLCPL